MQSQTFRRKKMYNNENEPDNVSSNDNNDPGDSNNIPNN